MNTLNGIEPRTEPKENIPYAKGSYNKVGEKEQWIRITEGCPNNCEFCRETKENGRKPTYYEIPEIKKNIVKIMDMNLIYKPKALDIINELGSKRVDGKVVYYELICGIDWRFLSQKMANTLKANRFKNIRLAWDYSFHQQKKVKQAINYLKKAGYSTREITVFMICNWKIPFEENMRKLDLCKVWNVKCADCWFDNQTMPDVKPIHWSHTQIKNFRRKVRKHNQLVGFGIDPEEKGG